LTYSVRYYLIVVSSTYFSDCLYLVSLNSILHNTANYCQYADNFYYNVFTDQFRFMQN